MADNKKWFKVWTSILTDPDFDDLHNQTIGAWLRLGAIVALLGENGKITLSRTQFLKRTHLTQISDNELKRIVAELGLINVEIKTDDTDSLSVSFLRWGKYQVDPNGYDRVKEWRKKQNDTGHDTQMIRDKNKKKEEEVEVEKEKRKEKDFIADFAAIWGRYPSRDGRKAAEKSFYASVKTPEDLTLIHAALEAYLASDRVKNGYIKNGSTWFNNWRDWIPAEKEKKPASPEAQAKRDDWNKKVTEMWGEKGSFKDDNA